MLLKNITTVIFACCCMYANSQTLADALGKKDTVLAAQIISKGYNLDSVDQSGTSLLMSYCRYGDDTLIPSFLLRHGAKPDYPRSPKGRTALIIACAYYGGVPLCRVLLNHGANINAATNDGVTALMMAAQNEKADVVAYLLSRGANTTLKDAAGKTALDYATNTNLDADVIKMMKCCRASKQECISLLSK